MLSNAYFTAKVGFDTADNGPAKILQNFEKILLTLLILDLTSAEVYVDARPGSGEPASPRARDGQLVPLPRFVDRALGLG